MNAELKELIENSNSIIVWDIDGTLTEARWNKKDIVFFNETDVERAIRHKKGLNVGLQPIKLMQDIVGNIAPHRQYTLSNTYGTLEDNNKNRMLDKYFPNIKKENRYYTRNIEEKNIILEMLEKENPNRNVIYISDSLDELISMNKYFSSFVHTYFYHTSSILV